VAIVPADLTQPGAVEAVGRSVEAQGLLVDTLVNNAGVGHTGRFLEEPPERILGMIDLNARASVAMTRRFVPAMVARQRGTLINVVSTAAFQPVPYLTVYAASKAFLLSFTEGLATELAGTGVQVQALCPGLTATEFQGVAGTEHVPFNRTGAMTPEAVVAASLAGLERGALRVVPGVLNRVTIAAQRLLPQSLVRKVGAKLFDPGH